MCKQPQLEDIFHFQQRGYMIELKSSHSITLPETSSSLVHKAACFHLCCCHLHCNIGRNARKVSFNSVNGWLHIQHFNLLHNANCMSLCAILVREIVSCSSGLFGKSIFNTKHQKIDRFLLKIMSLQARSKSKKKV